MKTITNLQKNSGMWPIEIDRQDYFPMESLLENNQRKLNPLEIEFDVKPISIKHRGDFFETEIELSDGIYRTHFWKREEGIYEVAFTWDREKLKPTNLMQYAQEFSKGTTSTYKKEPLKVFSFVISSVLSFIQTYHPNAIFLIANESRKVNSYQQLVKRISSTINWKVHEEKTSTYYQALIVNPHAKEPKKSD